MAKKKRGNLTAYYPAMEMPERWHRQADRLGMSVSNLVANVLDSVIDLIEKTPRADIGQIGRIVEVPEKDDNDAEPGEADTEGTEGQEAQEGAAEEPATEGEGEAGQEVEPVDSKKRRKGK